MITADESVFPNNVVAILKTRTNILDPDLSVFRRPLRNTDPNQSVGILGAQWRPDEDTYEIRGTPSPGRSEPTIQRYLITVQAFVKDMDEEKGLAVHSVLSKRLRAMLYRDDVLRIGLASLSVSMFDSTERTKRWGVQQQTYLSNELNSAFLYLSTLEFWLETETV